MRAVDLIHKKRLGLELTAEELKALVAGYVAGEVADYQMSAFAMAVLLQGMTDAEAAHLTAAMAASGEQLDWSDLPGVVVDKHSTGGVGDTTTLVLAPLVAAAGATVVKMSGRGLGHTGGTIDKLESIPGLRTALADDEMRAQARRIGLVVAAQTRALAPADKKLYALRDVTDTVESIPLIASSVMSKKLAAGAHAIVLDVKVGAGAFMKDVASARRLARLMVDIGRRAGRRVCALLTRMDEPLGWAIGNALEVREAILTLRGRGPADLTELCLHLGAQMLVMAGLAGSVGDARQRLQEALETGQALAKFKQLVAAQGGDPRVADDLSLLPQAPVVETLLAPQQGVVTAMQAEAIGRVAMALGAGRHGQEDAVDARVGLVLRRKVGEPVRCGEPLVEVHARTAAEAQKAVEDLRGLIEIRRTDPFVRPLVLEIIGEESISEDMQDGASGAQRMHVPDDAASGEPPQDLLQAAARARQRAYVPYSGFAVGAAVRLDDGRVVEGANIENASYGLTQCAERTALFSALMLGARPEHGAVRELLVLADSPQPVTPCGACRQVMAELCGPETPVWLTNTDGSAKCVRVAELLPLAFTQEQMRK